jgi:hypothetical protein
MLKKHTVKNLAEYISLANTINRDAQDSAWFRGHGSASYRLTPSVLRDTTPLSDARGRPLKGGEYSISEGGSVTGINPERMLDEFKRRSLPFLQFQPRNDFEWLFLMQHHGVPTRLIDWTTNALVALYFAVENITSTKHKSARNAASEFMADDDLRSDGVAIFSINPNEINNETIGIPYPVDVAAEFEKWKMYTYPTRISVQNAILPICILAPHITPRIRSQSGSFTLHGSNIWALDCFTQLRPLIHKIFIPYLYAEKIRQELHGLGITTSFIYPDLDGLSREIWEQEQRRYAHERSDYLSTFDSNP